MKNSLEVKMQVLDMLKDFLLGTEAEKVKPKAISVEVMSARPMSKDKEGLSDVLKKASKENPVEEEMGKPIDMDGDGDHDEDDHEMADRSEEDCDDEEDEKPRMTLKEFLKSRK